MVWLWSPPTPIPGVDAALPVVAFEVESSWRTRKHVKGDLLNLQDAAVSLGVIVLAGADPKSRCDASPRLLSIGPAAGSSCGRRATCALWRPECPQDRRLQRRRPPRHREEHPGPLEAATAVTTPGGSGIDHTGKYRPLWAWLRTQERRERQVAFTEVERVLSFPLPDSSRSHVAHWYSYQGSAVARAIIDAGWHASGVDLSAGTVVLVPGPPPRRR